MFILITGECEVIGGETTVQVFATHKQAYDAMVRDAKARAWDAGIPEDEFGEYVDSIGDDGGFILDVVGWQIREVPGAFIPADAAENLRKNIRAAADMLDDESLYDWYDADDICQHVCWAVEDYL